MKVWVGISMLVAVVLGTVDPNMSYWRINNNTVLRIGGGDLPIYCEIRYVDGTADRRILLPGTSMTSDKFREVDMEKTGCFGE